MSFLILIVFFILILIISLWLNKKYVLRPRPQSDFKLLKKELIYEYQPDGKHIEHIKTTRIKALRNGLDKYSDRYSWTGSGIINLIAPIDCQEVKETIRKNVWQLYSNKCI